MTDPLTTLLAVIPGLAKAGADIAASSDEAKRNSQLIEFQRVIIQLQSSIAAIQLQNAALISDKADLERQVAELKDWERERNRYSLATIWDGSVAYSLKQSQANGEPPHWLCTNCFSTGKKSLLNPVEGCNRFFGVKCAVCGTFIQGPWRNAATAEYAPS